MIEHDQVEHAALEQLAEFARAWRCAYAIAVLQKIAADQFADLAVVVDDGDVRSRFH
jgi:hypothetical protein